MVEVSDLAKNYGPKQVLEDVSFTIDRGDRIALVGVNGAGKSTLIRMLSGMEPPSSGHLRLGHNVTAEYFAQDQYKVLDGNARMLDDISNTAPRVSTTDLRSLLGCFLFSGDDVFKPLGVLSGGERNRYALARILVSPSNFLLLDEPTNHLDLRAKDVLLEAIARFNGTVVMVSHDRYFIDRLATRIFEIEGGHVHVYPGNYEDYMYRKQAAETQGNRSNGAAAVQEPEKASPEAAAAKGSRLNPIKLRQMQERCSFVEEEIPRLESSIADAEASLGVYESAEETQRLTQMLESLRAAACLAHRRMGRAGVATGAAGVTSWFLPRWNWQEFPAPWIRVKAASSSTIGPLTTSTQRKGIASRSSAFTVSAGILLSKIIGLVRERVFAHYFGNSYAADAFRGAFRIPNFLQKLFGEGVLSASFIPVYARLRAEERHEEAAQLAEAIFAILFLDRVASDTGRNLCCPLADRRDRPRLPW